MDFQSKFDIDDDIFVKTSQGVYKAKVCAIGIDMSQPQSKGNDFRFVYLVWASDRRDGAGHHERVYECNVGRTFEEAYYDSSNVFPWNIMDDMYRKDFKQFFKKHASTGERL